MKIAVYAIALDEARHVRRWAESIQDADYRIVADTGSTDGTPELLRALGVTVHSIAIRPWRFDDARNTSLALVPADAGVCIMLDLDNFMLPGWRQALEASWTPATTRLNHRLANAFDGEGRPTRSFSNARIHSRWGYRWRRAIHEFLEYTAGEEVPSWSDTVVMGEIQDRSKSRNYLPLLEAVVREDPNDSQACFWLARDLMWAGNQERSAAMYLRYLSLPTSTWTTERAEAMLHLADVQPDKKEEWLQKAIVEAPYRREVWLAAAEHFHAKSEWPNLFWACMNGLEKSRRTNSYLDHPEAWNFRLLDLGAIACWRLGMMDRAVELGRRATEMAPADQRLQHNLRVFDAALKRQSAAGRPSEPKKD